MKGVTRSSPAIRLDAAVTATMAQKVSNETRVELDRLRSAFVERDLVPNQLDPPTLTQALFTFIMPHLRSVSVLRLDRRRRLLARLMRRLERDFPDDAAASVGVRALRHELNSLNLLRGNRDSLIEG